MRNARNNRNKALLLLILFCYSSFYPTVAAALTGGPSQPEVQSFEPVSTSQMVDLSSGSFTYNIPLMDVGGYPINLAYHAGATMDEEASCVGLGWNINPGVINRNMRGLPDDFDGDKMKKERNSKSNFTVGGGVGVAFEAFGLGSLGKISFQSGLYYNNYRGMGMDFGVGYSPSVSMGIGSKSKYTAGLGLGLNLNLNSQNGASAGIQPSLSFKERISKDGEDLKTLDFGLTGGWHFNTKQGLYAASLNASVNVSGVEPFDDNLKKKSYMNPTTSGWGTDRLFPNSSYSYARPTYLPSVEFPIANSGVSFRGKLEIPVYGFDPGTNISGYISKQSLETKFMSAPGYGTMYLQDRQPGVSVLDFTREKDGPVTQYINNLALPVAAQDIYSVSGQGIGGSYLLKRGDVGNYSDKTSTVASASGNFSLEIGAASLSKFGEDIVGTFVESKTGAWNSDNLMSPNLDFVGPATGATGYEPAYFKQAGEQSVESDPTLFNNLGGFNVVDVKISKDPNDQFKVVAKDTLRVGLNGKTKKVTGAQSRSSREKRNQNISYLTAREASRVGLQKSIYSYPLSNFTTAPVVKMNRVSSARNPKHISEVTTTRQDGARYVYGLPAYNRLQRDYTFSVAANSPDCKTGLVSYTDKEISTNNNSGRDNFYSMEETPPYAHSFLLTAVLSPDYADSDGQEGPTDGDNGSFTRFNYSLLDSSYAWRLPFSRANNQASFHPGLLSDPLDNRASVVYGTKEIWHLHSVETKMYVAQFYYSNIAPATAYRNDGLQASGLQGGVNTGKRMVKLDSIVMYAKSDWKANTTKAVPIKKVSFDYTYALSKNVPNTYDGVAGKLTLTKLYFTYGRSEKGRFSPYQFVYAGLGLDSLAYNTLAYNRWGSFQYSSKALSSDCSPFAAPGNDEFPYANQDSLAQARYAIGFNLTKITLPSGGTIDVTYESNDYAYVQNKPAMQMFKVEGIGNSTTFGTGNQLYTTAPNQYLYFKLKNPISASLPVASIAKILERDYLKDIIASGGYLYYKMLANLKTTTGNIDHYEYVFGYARVESGGYGLCAGNSQYAYIKLQNVCLGDNESVGQGCTQVSPISKSAWQFTRLNYPTLLHSTNLSQSIESQINGVSAFAHLIESFADELRGLQVMFTGVNTFMKNNSYAQKVSLPKSWIRLYTPDGIKLAGGSRVKRIVTSDNWNALSGETDLGKYGQEYSYRTKLDLGTDLGDGNGSQRTMSSGVASYEPMIGNDENPFRLPDFYDETVTWAPDNHFYTEYPFGESFFPSPHIVYSKVTVSNLKYDNTGARVTPACVTSGTTVSEYYTAKDYPTITSRTPPQKIVCKTSPWLSFLKFDYKEYLTASQGYCIELNDMHGKPKAQWTYDDKGVRVSGVEYLYKTKKIDTDPSPSVTKLEPVLDSLDNTAKVIYRNGTVGTAQIGVDYQIACDSREAYQTTRTRGVALNVDAFLLAVAPWAVVIPLPVWETEKTRFRSLVITKVINRYALLDKVVAYDASSRIETENLAFDAETGEPMLTKTYNEFGDPIYNLKMPAHFAYSGMRPAYENTGFEVHNVPIQGSTGSSSPAKLLLSAATLPFFQQGDELMLYNATDTSKAQKAWVLNVNTATNSIDIIDNKGRDVVIPSALNLNLKIIRSGRRNQQSQPIGSVVLRTNPIVKINGVEKLKLDDPSVSPNILDAATTEYTDYWPVNNITGCTDTCYTGGTFAPGKNGTEAVSCVAVTNPFVYGRRGNWRAQKGWVYLADRKSVVGASTQASNVRDAGTYLNFQPFWQTDYSSSNIWTANPTGWTWNAAITKYNPNGFQVENKDPLGRYTSELPGYGNTQAIATAVNARYREIEFNGFEENGLDYLTTCNPAKTLHFPNFQGGTIQTNYRHSGLYSLQIAASGSAITDTIRTFTPGDPSENYPATAPVPESRLPSTITLGKMGFMVDSSYLLSAWVRTDESFAVNKLTYVTAGNTQPRMLVQLKDASQNVIDSTYLDPAGNVIEGWQRISKVIKISPSSGGTPVAFVKIKLINGNSTQKAFFDDFRIQPYRSTMKTYVYDPRSNRLLATLDDENFATFYEYDQSGMLERVKRETERGIMTIQESRTGQKKQ
jgi:hypothetical protein